MVSSQRLIVALLVVIAFLLGWIAAGTSGLGRGSDALPAALLPSAQAQPVLMNVDRDYFVTSSEDGATIYVWRLGANVNGHYDSVKVRSFNAASSRD